MSAKSIDDLYSKFTVDPPEHLGARNMALSLKISFEAKVKLEAVAAHVGMRKTPLLGEIAEAAIIELFDKLEGEMDDGILREVAEELTEFRNTGGM